MRTSAHISAATDPGVLEIARRIERKRMSIADNPLIASVAPSSSGQGWLRRLGLHKADIALSPEITLAKLLKEWYVAEAELPMSNFLRGIVSPEERAAKAKDLLNKHIGLIEYRVFGRNCGPGYPDFEDLASWLAWRTRLAHPEHNCSNGRDGWKPELFAFAIEDAGLSFRQTPRLF